MTVEELYWMYYDYLDVKTNGDPRSSGIALLRKGGLSRVDVSKLTQDSIDTCVQRLYSQGFRAHIIKRALTTLQESLAWLRDEGKKDKRERVRELRQLKQLEIDDEKSQAKRAPIKRELLSPNDACHVLGMGRSRLYELMRTEVLKYVQDGGRRKIPRAEIERYIGVMTK